MLLSLKQTLLVTRSDPRPNMYRLTLGGVLGPFVSDLPCKEFNITAKHFTLGCGRRPIPAQNANLCAIRGFFERLPSLRLATASLV
jgi:hypothetical protein